MSVRCSTRTPRRPGPALRICQMQRDALATRPTYQSLNRQHDAFDRGRIDRMFTGKISDTRDERPAPGAYPAPDPREAYACRRYIAQNGQRGRPL
ncbi:MAG TPA: hypothetical protein VE673_18635 [Pseudonocardiaceae bacterium]|nr:hypothetical protein [Pseudonocardiaceae bacterium]